MSAVKLFSVLQNSQFDYGKAYLAFHLSFKVDCHDEACVRWLPYTPSIGEVLDVRACEVTSVKSSVVAVQVERLIRSAFVKFNPGSRKTLEEARFTVNASYGSLLGFTCSSDNISVAEDEIVEEDAPRYLHDSTPKNNRGRSAFQRVKGLCLDYGLSVRTDIKALQFLLEDLSAALGLSLNAVETSVEHKEFVENRAKLKASVKGSESKFSDAQRRVREIEPTNDTVDRTVVGSTNPRRKWVLLKNTYSILRRNLQSSPIKCLLKTRKPRMNVCVFQNLRVELCVYPLIYNKPGRKIELKRTDWKSSGMYRP